MTRAAAAGDHPWEQRWGAAWRLGEALAAAVAVGIAVVAGVALPPLLPVAVAGATRVAVVRARRHASHPIADLVAGARDDIPAILPLLVVGALATLPLAGAVLASAGWTEDLATGVRVGVLLGGTLVGGWLAIGLAVAVATATPARAVPGAALLVASRAARRTVLAGACVLASVLLPLAGGEPSFAILVSGVAFLAAIRVSWPAIERLASEAGDA